MAAHFKAAGQAVCFINGFNLSIKIENNNDGGNFFV
jgi:hypothetical protein